mgnify:CR=1 FL=1
MSIKTDKAAQNHQKGYNCAQAVACAFAEEMEIDESIIFKMMEGHGLGMGCMEGHVERSQEPLQSSVP